MYHPANICDSINVRHLASCEKLLFDIFRKEITMSTLPKKLIAFSGKTSGRDKFCRYVIHVSSRLLHCFKFKDQIMQNLMSTVGLVV